MSDTPFWESPAAKAWIARVYDDMAPKMEGSEVVAQLVPDTPEADVKFWVELGASIMMDKPIVAIVMKGQSIPKKLEMIADEVIHIEEMNSEAADKLQAAFERVAPRTDLDTASHDRNEPDDG